MTERERGELLASREGAAAEDPVALLADLYRWLAEVRDVNTETGAYVNRIEAVLRAHGALQ